LFLVLVKWLYIINCKKCGYISSEKVPESKAKEMIRSHWPIPVGLPGSSPVGIAFDSVNGNLYVDNSYNNTVSVISSAAAIVAQFED
jgi:DNA-binding beta-propeller fold protein YncE